MILVTLPHRHAAEIQKAIYTGNVLYKLTFVAHNLMLLLNVPDPVK